MFALFYSLVKYNLLPAVRFCVENALLLNTTTNDGSDTCVMNGAVVRACVGVRMRDGANRKTHVCCVITGREYELPVCGQLQFRGFEYAYCRVFVRNA